MNEKPGQPIGKSYTLGVAPLYIIISARICQVSDLIFWLP